MYILKTMGSVPSVKLHKTHFGEFNEFLAIISTAWFRVGFFVSLLKFKERYIWKTFCFI